MTAPLPWWRTEKYTSDKAFPTEMQLFAGPQGIALVRLWPNGKTDKGWGMHSKTGDNFMFRYKKKLFTPGPILDGYWHEAYNFAFVMRSMKLVCIDIDGKNGGFQHAGRLGMLPLTLTETSKSGNGYHLFYSTDEDVWDEDQGYALFNDKIGIEQGVDIRATGCVYHYKSQRWNNRPIVELPQHLKDRLRKKEAQVSAEVDAIIKILDNGDGTEILLLHDNLLSDLKKPIPPGRRNTTLFAIGNQMRLADVPGWQLMVQARAKQVGLDSDEITKLINNITKYGDHA